MVGKEEIACYKQFLLFSQCFPQLYILVRQNVELCGNKFICGRFISIWRSRQLCSFSTVFNLHHGSNSNYLSIPEVSEAIPHALPPRHLLLSNRNRAVREKRTPWQLTFVTRRILGDAGAEFKIPGRSTRGIAALASHAKLHTDTLFIQFFPLSDGKTILYQPIKYWTCSNSKHLQATK